MKAFFLATYKRFLQSYPKEYRERFAQEMAQTFEDKLEDTQGFYNLLRLGFSTFIDFVETMLEQRLVKESRIPYINITALWFLLGGLSLILISLRDFLQLLFAPLSLHRIILSPGLYSGASLQLGFAFMYLIGFYNSQFIAVVKRTIWLSALTALTSSVFSSVVLFRTLKTNFNGFASLMDISLLLLLVSHGIMLAAAFMIWNQNKPLSKLLFWSGGGFTGSIILFLSAQLTTQFDTGLGIIVSSGMAISGIGWILTGLYLNKNYPEILQLK